MELEGLSPNNDCEETGSNLAIEITLQCKR